MSKVINLFDRKVSSVSSNPAVVSEVEEEITVTVIDSSSTTEDIKSILTALFGIEE